MLRSMHGAVKTDSMCCTSPQKWGAGKTCVSVQPDVSAGCNRETGRMLQQWEQALPCLVPEPPQKSGKL